MRIIEFLNDHRLSIAPPGHKHSQVGWVNFPCPFCSGNPGYHLGYWVDKDVFSCWRCGGHSGASVIQKLLNVSWADSYRVLKKYAGESHLPKRKVEMADQLEFPDGTAAMTTHHKRYLEGRNFDPDKLGRDWGLLGTGKKGSYRHRIIIPIYHKNVLVSYQGRDITGDHDLRYKACPKDQEVVEHKRTIYGMDKVSGNTILILEGVADVWRMGYGAVATYGIKYTPHQLAILRQKKNRFILFDPDPQAQVQAEKLYYQLSGFPGHTELLENDDGLDPGEMSQGEADDLMLDIIGR